jgi:hypothetical protein
VLGAVVAGVALAACQGTTTPLPSNPQITFTLDSAVVEGDTIHGLVVATGNHDLVELDITVFDTAGQDTAAALAGGGMSAPASKLTDKFTWKILHVLPGGYVRFTASAFDYLGDSTIVRDSTLVTP